MCRQLPGLKSPIICFIVTALILSCHSCQEVETVPVDDAELLKLSLTNAQLTRIQNLHILFGHQSVGENIIDGLKQLMEHNPLLQLRIQRVNTAVDCSNPVFGHFLVGSNTDPRSKCDSFKAFMDSGIGNRIDSAFFKFCFVDINENTNLEDIFSYYVETMEYLKNRYPRVTFIHVTTPLTTIPQDVRTQFKSFIKKILQRPDWVYLANVQRNKYNDMLRSKYLGKEPVFDLAAAESVRPDGSLQCFTYRGKTYSRMADLYSDDGGHLNNRGRIKAAKTLLEVLCSLE